MSLRVEVKQHALAAGFDLAGIAPIDACRDLEFARAWVERGYGGEMAYLKNPKRSEPRLILHSAKSVVCVGLVYNTDLPYSTEVCGPSSLASRPLRVDQVKKSGAGSRKSAGDSLTTIQEPGSPSPDPHPP
ncbi:MAG TPA: hypothetical protein VL523_16295, partial [Terriglobia bacterium]|nr:hypothetical protein [Terriglobia bacterium]